MVKYIKSNFHPGDLVKSSHGSLYIIVGSYQYLYGDTCGFKTEYCNQYRVFKVNKSKIHNSFAWTTLSNYKLIKHADDEIWDMIDKYNNKISKPRKFNLKDCF